tara:strand:+ start:115 stop:303 length:189 start_codon:yes stop_codon:yes gene_type:complete
MCFFSPIVLKKKMTNVQILLTLQRAGEGTLISMVVRRLLFSVSTDGSDPSSVIDLLLSSEQR